jgi:pimeloyl-ACP methyl ester carboxylesterase
VADGAPLDGLVLIAAPADVMRVTAEYLTDHGMPGRFIVTAFRPFFWRRIGSTFRELTPSRRIPEITAPLLMLQPEYDDRVVRDHADRLSAAAGQPYILIEGAEHTDVLEHPTTVALVEAFAAGFD